MKGNKDCKGYKELVMNAVDSLISKQGKAVLNAHVKTCADCKKDLYSMIKIRKSVSKGYEVPPYFEARIMAKIHSAPSSASRIPGWIKPSLSFAASFGFVMIVSLFVMNKGLDDKTISDPGALISNQNTAKTVTDPGSLVPEEKSEKAEIADTKPLIRDQRLEIRDLNIDTYSEHGPSVKTASGTLPTAEKKPSDMVVKAEDTAGLVMLKPGVIPTTTDNPLLDKDMAIVANNLINPLMGQYATIIVKVTDPANVKIVIYDKSVRPVSRILDAYKDRGTYEATWEGRTDQGETVSEGVYFAYIQIGTRVIKKAIIVNK